ncbi:MAG: VWA domain-containing protein [Spirochaetes bacterium]|nr:VWA domain-containing protein [Spirochaetota bacterium]
MKKVVFCFLFFIVLSYLHSQNLTGTGLNRLSISPEDVIIEEMADGGYHLWIRAREGIGSVMITESTADPELRHAVFALRAPTHNPINGDEIRILDGQEIPRDRNLFFLISSTPRPHRELGMAFQIFVPYVVEYGYPWGRHGEVNVAPGTFINIRSFERRFGDYAGAFMDNPFILDVIQLPPVAVAVAAAVADISVPDNFAQDAIDDFSEIAERTRGNFIFSDQDKLLEDIRRTIEGLSGTSIDVVFAIDTTESMVNHFVPLRRDFARILDESIRGFARYRVGLVFFKDYGEEYLTRAFPFTTDTSVINRHMQTVRVWGGGDRPEAVFEALHEAITAFSWAAENRAVILIGDAPGHPRPRGRITREMVYEEADANGVRIHTILLPYRN